MYEKIHYTNIPVQKQQIYKNQKDSIQKKYWNNKSSRQEIMLILINQ